MMQIIPYEYLNHTGGLRERKTNAGEGEHMLLTTNVAVNLCQVSMCAETTHLCSPVVLPSES